MEPTSLSRTLKTMESKGLIFRKVDKEDKRKVLILLSEEGVQLRKQVKEVVVSFNEKLFKEIPSNKLNAFFEVMEIIDENIEDELKTINRFF